MTPAKRTRRSARPTAPASSAADAQTPAPTGSDGETGAGPGTDPGTGSGSDGSNGTDAGQRLRHTRTLRGEALDAWRGARLAVIGAGVLGSRLVPAIVQSGADVLLIDPEEGSRENVSTQLVLEGLSKVQAVARQCAALGATAAGCAGQLQTLQRDIRFVGPGRLQAFAAIVDCSDDPSLAAPLTELSNGLGIPLVRVALDGSGEREMGRVLVSHGSGRTLGKAANAETGTETGTDTGAGEADGESLACQLCSYAPEDLLRGVERTPCPGAAPGASAGRPPTFAGGAAAMVVAGAALLQLQRLVGGRGRELALGHELLIDLDHGQMFPLGLPRSDECLSGHARWTLARVSESARSTPMGEVFDIAKRHFDEAPDRAPGSSPVDVADIVLEPFLMGHSMSLAAACTCGAGVALVGTRRAALPSCPHCNDEAGMSWSLDLTWSRFSLAQCVQADFAHCAMSELGLPTDGAVIKARHPGREPLHLLFAEDAPRFGPPAVTRRAAGRGAATDAPWWSRDDGDGDGDSDSDSDRNRRTTRTDDSLPETPPF